MRSKKIFAFLLAAAMLFAVFTVFASADEEVAPDPGIDSGNAVVAYCLDDDQFLYLDRADDTVAPAVAAKLVAMMVISDLLKERGLDPATAEVTVTATAISNSGDISDVRVPMMGFKAGNVYSAKDLISATLVANANDACAALACYGGELLGGNIITFIDKMNEKAGSLGLEHTHFANPTGLDAPTQVSTPREVAKIAAAFYRYNDLVRLSDVESFHFNNKTIVRSKNYLKSSYYVTGYLNKNAIGLIAGQKDKHGDYCLITASQKDGRTYIFVVMCATGMLVDADRKYSFTAGNAYDDMNKLIEWTRESFTYVTVSQTDRIIDELRVESGDSSDYVLAVPAENVEKLVVKSLADKITFKVSYDEETVYPTTVNGKTYNTVKAPVARGQKLGTVTFYGSESELVTVDLVAKDNVESNELRSAWGKIKEFLFGDIMLTVLKVIVAIIALYVVVALTMAAVRAFKRVNGGGKPKKPSEKRKKAPKPPKDEMRDTKEA